MSYYSGNAMIARDLSIQILDTFFQKTISQNLPISSPSNLHYISVMCYIIALKLTIAYSGFIDDFMKIVCRNFIIDKQILASHELLILNTIDYNMDPISTPSHIYHVILQCNPQLAQETAMKFTAESAITSCLQNSSFLRFSSSTIAIASMIYSCSMHHIDCNSWLNTLPDACFHNQTDAPLHHASAISACVDMISISVGRNNTALTPQRSISSDRQSPQDVCNVEGVVNVPRPPTLERYESCDLKRRKIEIQDIITPASQRNKSSLVGCFLFDTIVQSVALCDTMELQRKYPFSHEKDNMESFYHKLGVLF